jgi:NADH-quinone oxidoreductase subunit E
MPENVDLSLLDPILGKYKEREDALITMLQEIQGVYSYLPEEALNRLSIEAKVPMSRIYAVATFYAQFYLTPRGRKTVRVCRGTACHVRGGSLILEAVERELGIKDGETTPDLEFNLETVACIGACALAPAMVIDEDTYGKMTPSEAAKVINRKENKE